MGEYFFDVCDQENEEMRKLVHALPLELSMLAKRANSIPQAQASSTGPWCGVMGSTAVILMILCKCNLDLSLASSLNALTY